MFRDLSMHFNAIFTFGVILISGYLAGRAANFLKLPKVTGYIAIGILLEPSLLGILPAKLIDHSTVLSNFALCIITYAIGGSLKVKKIKELGSSIVAMTLFESFMTFIAIAAGLYLILPLLGAHAGLDIKPHYVLPLALLAGSLGSPTDPTPTLAVKEEYKADGPVTTTILGIGAFDDALGIINFSVAIAVCSSLLGGTGGGVNAMLIQPVLTIVLSILTGVVFALFLLFSARKVEDKGVIVVLIMGALFACFGTAELFSLDELLATMTLGCVVVNFSRDSEKFFMSVREYFEEMVFVVFFVVAGANLELAILQQSLIVILIFVVLRIAGKFAGSYTGALLSGAGNNVRKFTAFGLIPQGGVVVGLALVVNQDKVFSDISVILLNLILGTTVLFEFIGPLFTEMALKRSKEVGAGARGYEARQGKGQSTG
ncbi:MAG: hypothetical protein GF408_03785 [Candidatus Omnitrophica bacterium]|nr:hypothetical protein [Candidatus Omnitrophota bacterium]